MASLVADLDSWRGLMENGIVKAVSQTCRRHGDYIAKQWELPGGKSFFSPCPRCRDEQEKIERDLATNSREFAFRLQLANAGIGRRFYDASFDNYRVSREEEAEVLALLRAYTENFSRHASPNLVMYGNTGNGKTHLACAMASNLIRRGFAVEYLPILKLFSRYHDIAGYGGEGSRENFFSGLNAPDLLIIDEFGIVTMKDTERIVLHRVIDERYNRSSPIVMIGNMELSRFGEEVGERALRRVADHGEIVAFDWKRNETCDMFGGAA